MAIFRDFIDADCTATGRSEKLLMNRARRLRDANLISTKGHGLSAAQMTVDDAVAYTLGSFTTFSKAVDAPDEVKAFSAMPVSPGSMKLLTAGGLLPLDRDDILETFSTFGGTIKWIYELLLDEESLNGDQWNQLEERLERYESGDITLRKSRDTRDAVITLIPFNWNDKEQQKLDTLHIQFNEDWPDKYSVDCPVWESVTVPFSILETFASLLRGGEKAVHE